MIVKGEHDDVLVDPFEVAVLRLYPTVRCVDEDPQHISLVLKSGQEVIVPYDDEELKRIQEEVAQAMDTRRRKSIREKVVTHGDSTVFVRDGETVGAVLGPREETS